MSSRRPPAMPITRRELTALVAAVGPALAQAPTAVKTSAQSTPVSTTSTTGDKLRKATANARRISETLSNMEVPMNIEPAFSFRP